MARGILRFMSTRRLLLVSAGAMLAVGSFALALLALSGGEEASPVSKKSTLSNEPLAVGFESELMFGSLDEMVAASDLVMVGTVTEVRPGQVTVITRDAAPSYPEGTDTAGGQEEITEASPEELVEEIRELDTVVSVDNALKGSPPEDFVTVTTLDYAYGGSQSMEWRKPGERVLLFLSRSTETPGLYIPAEASYEQAVYILQGSDIVAPTTDPDEPVNARVTSLSLPELIVAVRDAKAKTPGG